ncbi:MAG: hypothetical protein V3U02_06880 [Calditrichia bacterium]
MDDEEPNQSILKSLFDGTCLGIAGLGILIVILGGIDLFHMYAGNEKDDLFWESLKSDGIGKIHQTGYSVQGNRIFIKYMNADKSMEILRVFKKAMVYDKYYFDSFEIFEVVEKSACGSSLYNGGVA